MNTKQYWQSYGSYLPILLGAMEAFQVKSVYEHGTGYISTHFIGKDYELEQFVQGDDSLEWISKVLEYANSASLLTKPKILHRGGPIQRKEGQHIRYKDLPYAVQAICCQMATLWYTESGFFDLIFVDGEAHMRFPMAQIGLAYAKKCIVMHDTEDKLYSYEELMVPDEWQKMEFQGLIPKTTILIHKDMKHRMDYFHKQVEKHFTKRFGKMFDDWSPSGPPGVKAEEFSPSVEDEPWTPPEQPRIVPDAASDAISVDDLPWSPKRKVSVS